MKYDKFMPWGLEVSDVLQNAAIPRHLQEKAYNKWAKKPDKKNMGEVINTFAKLINSEISKYRGTLKSNVLSSYAKKYAAKAVKTYNPDSGNQLSTHLVNGLQRIHRLNSRNVQGMRIPEEMQRMINPYMQAKIELEENLERQPTDKEVAKYMEVPIKKIKNLQEQMKFEVPSAAITYEPKYTDSSPEEEIAEFVYHDLPPQYKTVYEHKLGYNGKKMLSNDAIAKKLGISTVRVSQIGKDIADQIRDGLQYVNKI